MSVDECYRRFEEEGYLGDLGQSERKLWELVMLMEEQEQGGDGCDLAADTFFAD